MKPELLTIARMETQVSWDVTLCQWDGRVVPDISKDDSVILS